MIAVRYPRKNDPGRRVAHGGRGFLFAANSGASALPPMWTTCSLRQVYHRIHGDVDAPTAGFLGWYSDARARPHDTYIEAKRKLSRVKQYEWCVLCRQLLIGNDAQSRGHEHGARYEQLSSLSICHWEHAERTSHLSNRAGMVAGLGVVFGLSDRAKGRNCQGYCRRNRRWSLSHWDERR